MKDKHDQLVSAITQLESVKDVKDVFESPNKYGNIVSRISFKYDVTDRYNYSTADISIDHKINQVFIANEGYRILEGLKVEEVISHIIKTKRIK